MGYQPTTIATAIGLLNNEWFLPAIQREFVWKPEQVVSLFDSILRGYPISSFLFWALKKENRDKWEVYRFIENTKQGGTRNEIANIDGVHQMMLVLDGQQRLTSLLIGLKGTYTVKKKYRRWDDPKAWVKQRLHLDLLKDPRAGSDEEDDAEEGIHYGLAFFDETPDPTLEHYWFKAGRILNFDSEDAFYEFRDEEVEKLPDDTTKRQISVFQRNLERLYRAVWKDEVVAYYTEDDQDYDRVLDIFVRANEGGTKLSKSDLLLSMVTSKWGDMNARDEIFGFVDHINRELTRRNNFDKDFIMKTCLVVSDLPVAYKVKNFNNQNLRKIRDRWDGIKGAIERAVDLVNFFGIDRDNLASANALIPLIYYLYQRPNLTLRGSTQFEATNAGRVRKWVGTTLLNGVFGGHSDNVLRDVREVLQELGPGHNDFPVVGINEAIEESGHKTGIDVTVSNVLSLDYGRMLTFLALTLLYDDNGWGTMACHQDHIFPQSLFKPKALEALGFDSDKILNYRYFLKDKLGNLQLLSAQENEEKSDKPFEEWISTRDSGFKTRHLIPDDSALWQMERLEDFLKAREELITDRFKRLFSGVEGG